MSDFTVDRAQLDAGATSFDQLVTSLEWITSTLEAMNLADSDFGRVPWISTKTHEAYADHRQGCIDSSSEMVTCAQTALTWYGGLPGHVQSVLDFARYQWVNDSLQWIAGEPDKVAGLRPQYVAQGDQIKGLATQIETIASSMTSWTGKAHDSFDTAMTRAERQLHPAR